MYCIAFGEINDDDDDDDDADNDEKRYEIAITVCQRL